MKNKKISLLQFILTMIFVFSLLISNIIVAKEIVIFKDLTATAAILTFSITYILSDVFSEVYGYKWSRFTCYLVFILNLIMVLFFELSIALPSPEYYENDDAFRTILGNSPRIFIASLSAFMAGDFINDKVFQKLKNKHKDNKGFTFRALLSSLFGNMTDGMVFLLIAYLGVLSLDVILIIFITELILKMLYEILVLPITKLIMKKVSKYEGV